MHNTQLSILLLLAYLLPSGQSATRYDLPEPEMQSFIDGTEIVRLAENERFMLPLSTRTISTDIEYSPADSKECSFVPPIVAYKSQAEANLVTNAGEQIVQILPLPKKEKVFIADQSFNVGSYSIDQHFLLKKLSPKTLMPSTAPKLSTIALVATEDEQYIYYLTPTSYHVFKSDSLLSQTMSFPVLPGSISDIQKVLVYKQYLLLISKQSGMFVYRINSVTHELTIVQSLSSINTKFIDMEINPEQQLLYVLGTTAKDIKVYRLQDPDSKVSGQDTTVSVLQQYDSISLDHITSNHGAQEDQRNSNLNIEISTKRGQQSILVLFLHNRRNVIAQLVYDPIQQIYSFVRYFKFSMMIHEMHIINDIVAVVGSNTIGMLPFGISPRLILEEFNGFMAMTPIYKIRAVDETHFVGINKGSIEYAIILFENQGGLTCNIRDNSTLKTIKFKANLTSCSKQDRTVIGQYCTYEKTFMIERMDLAVSAPIADTLWIAMIVFLLMIVMGICVLFMLQKKRERAIRKLELYFEQKKRGAVSERPVIAR